MFQSELSKELYRELLKRGYPEQFCSAISKELNTDFTARRMLGYLAYYDELPAVEIADEMLAILSDRNAWQAKKQMENTQARWNNVMAEGFEDDEEE